jgi:cystathionine beta-lyase/cystathionine gamma-synthase
MDISYILNHLGEERENYFNAVAPPVIQSTNFYFKDVASLRAAFENEGAVNIYSRGNNPTADILRRKIAALAGAEDALVFASGVGAISAAVLSNVKAGDHAICVKKPYSWTKKLFRVMLPSFGVESSMVDGSNTKALINAIKPNTKLIYLESPNSMTFELQDIEAVVKVARERNIVTICDNSYCTSLGQRCIEMGVDIEVHSASKYYGGHSDVVAGYLIGSKKIVDKIFVSGLQNLGAVISPHDAAMLLRSLRTLPIRMERIKTTTEKVIAFMEQHPQVESVIYPFSKSFPQYGLAKKQMLWCGGLFSAQIKARNMDEMEIFCNSLKRFLMAVSWGGHESLIMPSCSFYPKDKYDSSVFPFNLIRFYIGLEDAEVLIEDIEQALKRIG